jgi:hypothetical protein
MAITVSADYRRGSVRRLVFDVVAAGNGAVADLQIPKIGEAVLLALATKPGSPAPTNGYNVRLLDRFGYDVLEGCGLARSNVDPQRTVIRFAGTSVHQCVDEDETLTLRVSDNLVGGARITIDVYYGRGI